MCASPSISAARELGDLQIEHIRRESHHDSVLFTQSCDLRGMLVERAQRQIDRNFVDNSASKVFRKTVKVAAQLYRVCRKI